MNNFRSLAIGATLVALGLLSLIWGWSDLKSNLAKRQWPVTSGSVVESYVIDNIAIYPEVIYEYRVNETVHRDTSTLHAPGFGSKRVRRDVARKSIVDYPPGVELTVFYNPVSPSESTLIPHPAWSSYGRVGTGIVLILTGLVFVSRGFIRIQDTQQSVAFLRS